MKPKEYKKCAINHEIKYTYINNGERKQSKKYPQNVGIF